MAKYLVTYDLVGTDETSADYERLIKRIKEYAGCTKVQKSVWLVLSEAEAEEVFNDLKVYVDKTDRLFVVALGALWWGRRPIDGFPAVQAFFNS